MSALPKKKLCWNCEGNVAKDIDNCPYCGVYVHASEIEEESLWNPSYHSFNKTEEIPPPPYQQHSTEEENEEQSTKENKDSPGLLIFSQFKRDIFPILFLMSGSILFLFGVVLLLFSQNGTFTLQWQENQALYFLLLALPLIGFGWKFLQDLDET